MRYDDPRDRTSPFVALPEVDAIEAQLPVGWDSAVEYHRLKRILPAGPMRARVREAAITAVLDKAADAVRHAARPTRIEASSWLDQPEGDLDLDASLDAGVMVEPGNPETLRVTSRNERRADIALILDMSLSMTGEKVALVAVAAAVLALKLHREDLGVVVFDSTAMVLKKLGETLSPRDFVQRILEVPARGYTNLEAGMREGLSVLRGARRSQRCGVLMTDGIYNIGWDPTPLAPLFPRLHVIQLGEDGVLKDDRGLCQHLAAAGRGRHYRAESYEDLPRMAYRLVQDLFR